jgi:hypothetical protein
MKYKIVERITYNGSTYEVYSGGILDIGWVRQFENHTFTSVETAEEMIKQKEFVETTRTVKILEVNTASMYLNLNVLCVRVREEYIR